MKMNKFETYACDQIFHSYPENKSFDEIIYLCENDDAREALNDSLEETENDDQQLCLCEQYEHEWWDNISILLKQFRDSSEYHFGDNK